MIVDKNITYYDGDDKHFEISYLLDNDMVIRALISTNYRNAMISLSVQWRNVVRHISTEISRIFVTELEIQNLITDALYQLQRDIIGGLYET